MNTPIFDEMVREYQQRTGRTYASLLTSKVRDPYINRNPFAPRQDEDTMVIPRVMPLQQKNVA